MRLTLRTLLAYLDKILDDHDRILLEKKIQESDFAQNLIRRSRDTLTDQDLSAMDPIGHGIRQDPNLVAEYLDNTMAKEQIEEFERQCLDMSSDADTRLAEITACHHILTIVLGEPLQFTASSRERMYRIGDDGAIPLSAENSEYENAVPINSQTVSDAVNETHDSTEAESELAFEAGSRIPGYLRDDEKRSRWLPLVATTMVAAVITGLLLVLFSSNQPAEESNAGIARTDLPASVTGQAPAEGEESPSDVDAAPPSALVTAPPAANATEEPGVVDIAAPSESVTTKTPEPTPQAEPEESTQTASADAQGGSSDVPVTLEDSITSEGELPDSAADKNDPSRDKDQEIAEESTPSDTTQPVKQVLGRLISEDQILLATRTGFDDFRWLPPQSNLETGHQLLALPTFRPNLVMIALTVELEGGSLLSLLDLSEGGIPTIKLSYGRMVVRTNRNDGRFKLTVNQDRIIEITLKNTETIIGIEVQPQQQPGLDPELSEQQVAVNLYAMRGAATWHEGAIHGTVQAGQNQNLTQMPPPEPESVLQIPEWIVKAQMTKLESRAVPAIRNVVQADRSVKLSLLELVEKRRQVEVKQLALRCCAHIGYFAPLIEALGDEKMKSRWGNCIVYLSDAVWRDPEYAKRVRMSLENIRNEKGFDLYRMLWGYTNEGLINNGEAAQLVEFLSSDDLDYRVLSHWNLNQITGKGYSYQPQKSEQQRKLSVKRWQSLLDKVNIKHSNEN